MRHRVRCKLERRDIRAMARPLVVEREAVAGVTEFGQTAVVADPRRRACPHRRQRPRPLVGGLQRILGQQVLDVGEDQLLVLLLVVESELDRRRSVRRQWI